MGQGRAVFRLLGPALAIVAGCAIAWMDTRPTWDDTGVTAGALFLAAGLATFLGLRWWLSALLVAGPLVAAEFRGAGWGLLVAPAIAAGGAAIGTLLHRLSTPRMARRNEHREG